MTDIMQIDDSVIDVPATGSRYSIETKRTAVAHYFVHGNASYVARLQSIPTRTVRDWVMSDWGQKALAALHQQNSTELDCRLTYAIHKAVDQTIDRVEFGEPMVDKSTGEPLVITNAAGEEVQARKPVACQTLATTAGILYDKRQIGRNLPTRITSSSDDSALRALKAQFESLAGRTIEGEVVGD